MNRDALIAAAGLSVFTSNAAQAPADYAASQMKGRGDSFTTGAFKDTGRKLVAAQAVNGVALVTLSRVNLTDHALNAAGEVPKGFQIVAYDLSGNVLSETPLNEDAPKGTKRGYAVYGEIVDAISKRDDLIFAAIRSARDVAQNRVNELEKLLAQEGPKAVAEAA